jgi:acetylornithine deacetylase/succinyl-diaminopimelate desuccinylase-like protein
MAVSKQGRWFMRISRKEFLKMAGAGLLGAGSLGALPFTRRPESFEAVPLTPPEDLTPIYKHIEQNREQHLKNLQDFLRQPGYGATGEGMRESADMVVGFLKRIGCQEVELVETDGYPLVWGKHDAGASKTLVNYGMYDTQPIFNPEGWISPPHEARVVDLGKVGKAIVARGATNQRGPIRAFLNACESILEVKGELPINLIFTIEGEEEQGSPHLEEALLKKQDDLRQGDATYFATNLQDEDGEILLGLGVKGIIYMELEASGARWGRGPMGKTIHGSHAAIVESPAWRLVGALASMTSENGMAIEMEGYTDKVAPPSEEDAELIRELLPRLDIESWKERLSADHYYKDLTGEELLLQYLYTSTWNIDGMYSGWTGPGMATLLPDKATAKVDSRLVPNQTAAESLAAARRHLDSHGYSDIEIRTLCANEWAKTSPRDPFAEALIKVYKNFGINPIVLPILAGSAPDHLYSRTLFNMPFLRGGMGHGANLHTVNEYMVVEGNGKIAGLAEVERSYVDFLYTYAAAG